MEGLPLGPREGVRAAAGPPGPSSALSRPSCASRTQTLDCETDAIHCHFKAPKAKPHHIWCLPPPPPRPPRPGCRSLASRAVPQCPLLSVTAVSALGRARLAQSWAGAKHPARPGPLPPPRGGQLEGPASFSGRNYHMNVPPSRSLGLRGPGRGQAPTLGPPGSGLTSESD